MINEINLYGVDTIIEIGKMFEEKGMKLGSLFLTDNIDIKVKKNTLDIHGHDLSESGKTKAYVSIDNDEKFHRMWFRLDSYRSNEFDNWKLVKEDIEYR